MNKLKIEFINDMEGDTSITGTVWLILNRIRVNRNIGSNDIARRGSNHLYRIYEIFVDELYGTLDYTERDSITSETIYSSSRSIRSDDEPVSSNIEFTNSFASTYRSYYSDSNESTEEDVDELRTTLDTKDPPPIHRRTNSVIRRESF